jgi:CheY-like chemotaxis protein
MKLPIALTSAFAQGDGVVWLGAGSSIGSGLPSWDALIAKMRSAVVNETSYSDADLKSLTHLEMAQLFRTRVRDHYYSQFLWDELRPRLPQAGGQNRTLNAVANLVNSLHPNPGVLLVSTNFDTLLEDTMKTEHGKQVRKIVTTTQLAGIDENQLVVIKPNGDIEEPASIVFTLQDYCEFRVNKQGFAKYIENLLTRKTILFVGYGLSDFTFNSMLGEIQASLGQFKRRAYAILKNDSPARCEVLKSLSIEVVDAASFDEIPLILAELAREATKPSGTPQTFVSETMVNTTFLLVDDDSAFVENVKQFYNDYRWTGLDVANNARDAMDRVREKAYDFILTDLVLPNSSGRDVVRAARQSPANARSVVAVWSGSPPEQERMPCVQAGADTFLCKGDSLGSVFLELFALKRLRDGAYAAATAGKG